MTQKNNEFSLPVGNDQNKRETARHLPSFFRTDTNKKFLGGTLDPLTQPGKLDRINAFVGRRDIPNYKFDDSYLEENSTPRQYYQLEPSFVYENNITNDVSWFTDYIDYVNSLKFFGADVKNHSKLNKQEAYSWDPGINWDKLVNYREYYWLPNGTDPVTIFGEIESTVSTYKVTLEDQVGSTAYVFSPDGLTANPKITLFKGVKYRFDINTPGHPFAFKTSMSPGDSFFFDIGVSARSVENGIIEFEVPLEAPDTLYYLDNNGSEARGMIVIRDISESSFLDINSTILGKKTFASSTGVNFVNGLKIKFAGQVVPETYSTGFWIVEGVGESIKLIKDTDLAPPIIFNVDSELPFDNVPFDSGPWDSASNIDNLKDYIVINRASKDKNAWTRNNKWVHRVAIEESAKANNSVALLDQFSRATRPIIEFKSNLKLFNHGYMPKNDVDLVDDVTLDVFSTIEGSTGYFIDGEQIYPGYRILFIADTDKIVNGRVFEVKEIFNLTSNKKQLTLQEVNDTEPFDGETVYVKRGKKYRGSSFHYENNKWKKSQNKINVNQPPLFDLFDEELVSYSDQSKYPFNTFEGNKIFSYKIGNSQSDPILGFPLEYRNIVNVGDIEFIFNLQNESWTFVNNTENQVVESHRGFLRILTDSNSFNYSNGWTRTDRNLEQNAVRILEVTNPTSLIAVDVFDDSGKIRDLKLRVFVNEEKRNDVSIEVIRDQAFIKFEKELKIGDKVVCKARSNANKNDKGYYELPLNWQNNPLNHKIESFTFGEVIDHVKTIVENSGKFEGSFPGNSNLDSLGDISNLGRKFLQHGGSISLSSYLLTDKNANLIKSLRWNAKKYSEFKKEFIRLAETSGIDGSPRDIVDQLLLKNAESKYLNMSAFYFSDMVPFGGASTREYIVEDARLPIFVIDSIFTPNIASKRNILIYLNDEQLLNGIDYEFNQDDAFVTINRPLVNGDRIVINDYETTDGCYVPTTPSKLGLYPLYEPQVYVDNSYREPTLVIQGHDGSILRAYGDYRDDLILELEKRIFNSCRVQYDTSIFNIHDVLGGYYRRTEFTRSEINNVMLNEFLRWNSITSFDFNQNDYFVATESFTYNYNNSLAPNGRESLPGFWRGTYNHFFDTDRPHTHPWEIQGFTIKPEWWEQVYGPSPYTKDNKILWESIERGIIRDPNKVRADLRYARPGLSTIIPVDDQGNLISPLDSDLAQNFSQILATGRYEFGDGAPVETSWRRSCEYPFAVMIALSVLRSSDFIAKSWDRFTVKRNIAGQIYSTKTGKFLSVNELPFPSSTEITSGLVNILDEYITVEKSVNTEVYKTHLTELNAKLRYRVSGFTSKDKIRVLLDSRSPNASGTIFMPEENYKVFYNKSFPISTISYSGVIVEKVNNGFAVRGYDTEKNYFEFLPVIPLSGDRRFNVGGVSDTFVDWRANQFYTNGQIVRFDTGEFYRAKVSHNSSEIFIDDIDKWQRLPSLPMTGGRDAIRRTKFESIATKLPYGTVLEDIQSVVDFLYGYQEHLKSLGFVFDGYDNELNVPLNWDTSIKEFMFWTLQSWANGSIITLSPAALKLRFVPTVSAAVDSLNVDFYDYSVLSLNGSLIQNDLTNVFRDGNELSIQPLDSTSNGIYHVRINLIYKEHIILFDNKTIFNDVIYDVVPGYRQGRLKLVGFKTSNWSGGYEIPGFIFDEAKVSDWDPNVDYTIGDIVKYQDYYFTAIKKVTEKSTFDFTDWQQTDQLPEQGLIPNLDYRVEQFRDLYDLESSNIDTNQQNLARHLIGYQPRQYLENIINDDVAQFKFYQGFIKEKGTFNSIEKLFDVLRASGFSSIDLKEEWAFRVGSFGATDAFSEIEFPLNETKVVYNPQTILLTKNPVFLDDPTVYTVPTTDVAIKPIDYNASPFVTKLLDHNQNDYDLFKYKVAGYVRETDVDHIVLDELALFNYDLSRFKERDKVWIGNTPAGDWNVYNFINTQTTISKWSISESIVTLFCNTIPNVIPGDIIAIKNLGVVDGIYRVQRVYNNIVEIVTTSFTIFSISDEELQGILFKFEKVRLRSFSEVSEKTYNYTNIRGEKIWVDTDQNNYWQVLENQNVFKDKEVTPIAESANIIDQQFGSDVTISKNDQFMFVSSPSLGSGVVFVYSRPSPSAEWVFIQNIFMPTGLSDSTDIEKFGESVSVSDDGQLVAISALNLSNLKSFFKNEFIIGDDSTIEIYNQGEVVRYQNTLWVCLEEFTTDGTTTPDVSNKWKETTIYEATRLGSDSGLVNQGAVFVYRYDPINRRYEREITLGSITPTNNERFGSKVKIVNDKTDYWLFVSSKHNDQDTGQVQIFRKQNNIWSYNTNPFLDFSNVRGAYPSIYTPTIGSMYGYSIDVSLNASFVAVSAPFLESGAIYIFERTNNIFELVQVIDSYTINMSIVKSKVNTINTFNVTDLAGYSLAINSNTLLVSSPNNDKFGINTGVVYHFGFEPDNTLVNPFVLTQVIKSPVERSNEKFGTKLAINNDNNVMIISAIGGSSILDTTFDNFSERLNSTSYELDPSSSPLTGTTFNSKSTIFFDKIPFTGAVYVFNRFDDKFIYADKLYPENKLETNDSYGFSIAVSKNTIIVGTPKRIVKTNNTGSAFLFNFDTLSWKTIATQDRLIDILKFKKAFIYNKESSELLDNLDIIDPAKGKIAGIADQELSYQTYYDPAIYEFGDEEVSSVDKTTMWTDENVGKLWWDLNTVKFIWYEQGDSLYRNNNWGRIFPGSSVDIYEWVETPYLPSRWADLANSSEGLALGVSGTPKDPSDFTYSTRIKFDPLTKTRTVMYYYWVKNSVIVPRNNFRSISSADVAKLIIDPKSQGLKFVAITNENSISISNVNTSLSNSDVMLNLKYYLVDNTDLLTHREYALVAKDDKDSLIPRVLENKWFDSLSGVNEIGQRVPDPKLNVKQKYGTLNNPRQGWFVNRIEALKQFIVYVNSVLIREQIASRISFKKLLLEDPAPTFNTGLIDQVIDINDELRFIGTANIRPAEITATIINGRIENVFIRNHGYGYKYAPTVTIRGPGKGAEILTEIDNQGRVISANIIKKGNGYDVTTQLLVRNYSVLVLNDSEAFGAWSIQEWQSNNRKWQRIKTQAFNTKNYWYYSDWYAPGFGPETSISYVVDNSSEIFATPAAIGETIKVLNAGNNKWILLQRKALTNSFDYTVDYAVVGNQDATIQFSDALYNFNQSYGYDNKFRFDSNLYDRNPTVALRNILESIRDDILINDLRIEYINVFFNSVHYVFSEQKFVDWAFKTSFLKVRHSVGTLKQRVTFQSDPLESYQEYIEEAKPYKSKIREFVSSYNVVDPAHQQTTDFDLPAVFDNENRIIKRVTINDNEISNYPWKSWLDNYTYVIKEIVLSNPGDGYITPPKVIISGGNGTGAKATALIAQGKVYKIVVDDPGTGYLSTPSVFISGGNGDNEENRAQAYAVITNNKVRTNLIGMKYDRVTPNFEVNDFSFTDTFIGNGSQTKFKLTYAPDLLKTKIKILVNNNEIYGAQYEVEIVDAKHATYQDIEGFIVFRQAPAINENIVITYDKNIKLYNASDRINYAYNPTEGQYGKELGQLMSGVDYGGVQITGIDFDINGGWDSIPWDALSWDNVPLSNDDFTVLSDGTTREFVLPYIPELGEIITVYQNGTRIDDPYFDSYDGITVQPNNQVLPLDNALMNSFVGDGETNTIFIPGTVDLQPNDIIIFIKATSDGTILPTDQSAIDTLLSGGDLTYTTAIGIKAEDIIVDGDGFNTEDTAHGPEELLQGQVVDTLSINVFSNPTSGGPTVFVQNFVGDGSTDTFDLRIFPITTDSVLVLVNNVITTFVVDYATKTVQISDVPPIDSKVVIITYDLAGIDITERNTFIGDGETTLYSTASRFNDGNVSGFITVNGLSVEFELKEDELKNINIEFETAPELNDVIQVVLFSGTIKKWSEVHTQDIQINPQVFVYNLNPMPANIGPLSSYVFVVVDGEFLQAPDYEHFVFTGTPLTINDIRYTANMLSVNDIEVYLKGRLLTPVSDYQFNNSQNIITVNSEIVKAGDEVTVEILLNADFVIKNNQLHILKKNYSLLGKQLIKVTTFTNHDILKIKTINETFRFKTGYDMVPYDIVNYDPSSPATNTSGVFNLPRTVSSKSGVFVSLSNMLLAPNVDYVVLDNLKQVKVNLPDILTGDDHIQIITFNEKTVIDSIGFKIFKDMLNRTHYKRMSNNNEVFLVKEFNYFDTEIVVNDASKLPVPGKFKNLPGVIEIDKERVEYFEIDGNTLKQIRRATLGTGLKTKYEINTPVNDVSIRQTLPYVDREIRQNFVGDGSTISFEINQQLPVNQQSMIDNWYRETIPEDHGQCDSVEIFVSGKRLRKSPTRIYDQELGQNSFAGDKWIEAEFSVVGNDNIVRLTVPPKDGEIVSVVLKQGKIWQSVGDDRSLATSDSRVAKFLTSETTNLPK
jgi:hypothetical protein